ncbi:MAG: polymer-forming cytoskeletal protein [Anaerolineae bacterium]|nr:polymer-forming cytoskeletal protein [Anaerolineae bacterium]
MSFFGGRKQQEITEHHEDTFPAPPPLPRSPVGFETVLGASTTLQGDLKSQANVRLDGTFEGTLAIDGNVLVGETAKITADIHAKNVSIAGAVRGNVSGKKVQLLRTGRVWGDITATSISTEEGAFIDGKITMITHAAAQGFDPSTLPLPDDFESEPSGGTPDAEAPVKSDITAAAQGGDGPEVDSSSEQAESPVSDKSDTTPQA